MPNKNLNIVKSEDSGQQTESDYYPLIKTKIEDLLKTKFNDFYLEITGHKKFSKKLKMEISPNGHRDIVFSFLKNAAPDIIGFIRGQYSSADFLIAEIKTKKIKLDDIYQTRRYSELFNAKYAFLISTEEIPVEIIRLSKVVSTLLRSGYSYENIVLVHYDKEKEDFTEWYEKNPFL